MTLKDLLKHMVGDLLPASDFSNGAGGNAKLRSESGLCQTLIAQFL